MNNDLRERPGGDLPSEPTGPNEPGRPELPDPSLPNDEAGPIGARLGHDPNRLGDEVAGEGDLVYPTPETETPKSM